MQCEVKKQMFSILNFNKTQTKRNGNYRNGSLVASFVRVPHNHSKMDVKTYRKHHEKGSNFWVFKANDDYKSTESRPEMVQGFPGWQFRCVSGGTENDDEEISMKLNSNSPSKRLRDCCTFLGVSCSKLYGLECKSDSVRSNFTFVRFHFIFQILHINTQLPASCPLPCQLCSYWNYVRLI